MRASTGAVALGFTNAGSSSLLRPKLNSSTSCWDFFGYLFGASTFIRDRGMSRDTLRPLVELGVRVQKRLAHRGDRLCPLVWSHRFIVLYCIWMAYYGCILVLS